MKNQIRNNIRFSMRGFTLIELLVVMAIFGVLVAALFSVFVQIKNSVATTGATRQLQEILMSQRRDAIDTVIPEDLPDLGNSLGSILVNEYYVIVDSRSGSENFSIGAVYTKLSDGIPIKRIISPDIKKEQYSAVEIEFQDGACGDYDSTTEDVFKIHFISLTGEMEFYQSGSSDPVDLDSCTIDFFINNGGIKQAVRSLTVNSEERTIDIEG